MKKKIITYLEGPRNIAEGIALVMQYSRNIALIRALQRRRQDAPLASPVFEELRQLAGLSLFAFQHMKRHAKRPPESPANGLCPSLIGIDERPYPSPSESQPSMAAPTPSEPLQVAAPVSDTVQKMINFRKRFPFLNDPKCPDVLKILVADMFTAYGNYREAHRQLEQVPDDKMAPELTEKVLDNYLEDRAIMEELEYYRDNGHLLGKHPKVAGMAAVKDIADLTDFELAAKLKNANSNISKANVIIRRDPEKAPAAKERLAKWIATRDAIQKEIDRRSNKS